MTALEDRESARLVKAKLKAIDEAQAILKAMPTGSVMATAMQAHIEELQAELSDTVETVTASIPKPPKPKAEEPFRFAPLAPRRRWPWLVVAALIIVPIWALATHEPSVPTMSQTDPLTEIAQTRTCIDLAAGTVVWSHSPEAPKYASALAARASALGC